MSCDYIQMKDQIEPLCPSEQHGVDFSTIDTGRVLVARVRSVPIKRDDVSYLTFKRVAIRDYLVNFQIIREAKSLSKRYDLVSL